MDSTFVRKDFYLDPPGANATAKEWEDWQKADARKAAAAKAAHTKSQDHAEVPGWLGGETPWQAGSGLISGGDGVHRQGTMVGFTGDSEAGDVQIDRVCPRPSPEALIDIKAELSEIALRTNKRGGKRAGKSARRRKNKRKAKK